MSPHELARFPRYTPRERLADTTVHVLGVGAAALAGAWLLATRAGAMPTPQLMLLAVYAAALSGTLTLSAAYNLTPPGMLKERLRRVDHAMVFVMIAGTFTGFAAAGADAPEPPPLGAVWIASAGGAGFKLAFPRRFERVGMVLYLGLGWAVLAAAAPLIGAMSAPSLALLAAGGVLYTVGAAVHMMDSVPFHNAAWHALVVIAAGCHFAVVAIETG